MVGNTDYSSGTFYVKVWSTFLQNGAVSQKESLIVPVVWPYRIALPFPIYDNCYKPDTGILINIILIKHFLKYKHKGRVS